MVSDRRTVERTIVVTVVLGAMLAPLNSTMITVALPTLLIAPVLILGLRLPAVSSATSTGRFDLRGAALLICGLVSLVLALTVWRLPGVPLVLAPVLGLLAVGTSLALVLHTGRSPKPVLNLALFRARGFTPAVTTVLLSNLTMYTLLLSLPVFLIGWGNWDDEHVGLLLAGLALPMVFFSPLGGRLSDRSGRRLPAFLGTVLIALGTLPFLAIAPFWSWPVYLAPLVLLGIGSGLSMASMQATAIETVSLGRAGQAAGLFSTMRYLGSILGSSVMAAVLSGSTPPVDNFRVLYAAMFLSSCGAIITAWGLPTWIRGAGRSETGP